MHEAGLAQTALEVAAEKARERGATRVHRLTLRVGDLSGVVPDALRFALEALSPGTPAEGSAFDIEVVPVECHCPDCEAKRQRLGVAGMFDDHGPTLSEVWDARMKKVADRKARMQD